MDTTSWPQNDVMTDGEYGSMCMHEQIRHESVIWP